MATTALKFRRSIARLYGVWRRFADDPERASDECIADILLLPLTGMTFSLFVMSMPGSSEAITRPLDGLHALRAQRYISSELCGRQGIAGGPSVRSPRLSQRLRFSAR